MCASTNACIFALITLGADVCGSGPHRFPLFSPLQAAATVRPRQYQPNLCLYSMSIPVVEFLQSQPGLAVLVGVLAALGTALVYLCTRHVPEVEQEEPEIEPEPELSRLRTRPLKPAIDLTIYTYGDQ